ncbi:MAG: Pilus assembly protein PilO [Sporomusa sp.]|jgi:type IV pilus assembly protein PilO|nr:Pilus assembly protein PilO [Sporomusa sp.]
MDFSWAKVSTKHKSIVFTGGLLLAFWLCYSQVIEIQNRKLADLKAQLQTAEQKIAIVQGFARGHPDPAVYLAELAQKAALIESMLPNHHDLGGLLAQVEESSKGCGLQLIEIKPSPTVTKTGYYEIPIEVIVRGSFIQTLNFLKKIEDIPRYNSINNVIMNSRQGILDSKLVLVVYSYGVPPGSAAEKQVQIGQPDKK